MSNQSQMVLAAVIYAAGNEQDGYRFYLEAARHIKDSRGSQMFRGLADDEVKHYQILMANHASLKAGGGWLTLDAALAAAVTPIEQAVLELPADTAGLVPQQRLFPHAASVMAAIDAGAGDLEAVDLAIAAEKRGYDLYARAAAEATDGNAKTAYHMLMQEEARHYDWLQRSRGYLAASNTYWDESELPFFEG